MQTAFLSVGEIYKQTSMERNKQTSKAALCFYYVLRKHYSVKEYSSNKQNPWGLHKKNKVIHPYELNIVCFIVLILKGIFTKVSSVSAWF